MNTPAKQEPPEPRRFRKPVIGSDVHFFDETREQSKNGSGPYAAKVIGLSTAGVAMIVFTTQGSFPIERMRHRSEQEKTPGKKKFWNWPDETPKAVEVPAKP